MSEFAASLGQMMGQKVIDRTNLAGRFDLDLRARAEGLIPSVRSDPPELPSIFVAVQEQLGLRLVEERGPVETFIVDSVQMPTTD
jgi:uncharacterized protein (TIGR03435 family)